jgi:putative transposase
VVSALQVRLVFGTKYLHGVLNSEHIRYLTQVFSNVRSDLGATLAECKRRRRQMHLLIEYPPKVPVSTLTNYLKGVPVRRLGQRYQVRTDREHMWSPAYFAARAAVRHWRSSSST